MQLSDNERWHRTLLLTGTAPEPCGVGGIILHDLCAVMPAGSLCVALLAGAISANAGPVSASGNSTQVFPIATPRSESSRWGIVGRALKSLASDWRHRRALARTVDQCVVFGRGQKVAQVWAVLDSPASICLARPLAKALGVPLRVLVWDDVDHNTRYFGLHRLAGHQVRRAFADAIAYATSLAVIGESMRDAYQRRYGKRGVILRHGIDRDHQSLAPAFPAAGGIRIGFAGSVTARSAFNLLLRVLDRIGWRLDGVPITLVLMGGRFDLWSSVPRNIECLGWRSVDDTLRALSGCTLNYLPQAFEEDWRAFSELSFPSKLTTYLAAGAPILLHAPTYASLPNYFRDRPIGALCTTLDAGELELALKRLATDESIRAGARSAANEALSKDFSASRFLSSFFEFMGVEGGTQSPQTERAQEGV